MRKRMSFFKELRTFLGSKLDMNGQPLNKAFRSEAVIDRQIDELIGLIKGVMADGMVHQGEVEFLIDWMNTNHQARDKWPAKAIYPRLVAAMEDGIIDLDEEREIMDVLLATIGGNTAPMCGESSNSTALPYTKPFPEIDFYGRTFCFTGKFACGSRRWCEESIEKRGGIAISNITKKLDYLVIGEIGSRDWIHSTHGRKIEKAIEYNENGVPIYIISEQYWYEKITA